MEHMYYNLSYKTRQYKLMHKKSKHIEYMIQ